MRAENDTVSIRLGVSLTEYGNLSFPLLSGCVNSFMHLIRKKSFYAKISGYYKICIPRNVSQILAESSNFCSIYLTLGKPNELLDRGSRPE